MSEHPLRRFLDVDPEADLPSILGLTPDRCDPATIEAALRERMARTYEHPEGRSAEAELVRQTLREAARLLTAPGSRTRILARAAGAKGAAVAAPAGTRPALVASSAATWSASLTWFDRNILAILVGSGGWNATSRSRIIALARAYGVTLPGLMRVISGLSHYARAGRSPLGASDIAAAGERVELPYAARRVPALLPSPVPTKTVPAPPASTTDPSSPQAASPEPGLQARDRVWPMIRAAALAACVVLVAGILLVRAALRPAAPPVGGEEGGAPAAAHPEPGVGAGEAPPRVPPRGPVRAAVFPGQPMLRGQAPAMESVIASDRARGAAAAMEDLALQLESSDAAAPKAIESWFEWMDITATGWVLIDRSSLAGIHRAMESVLEAGASVPGRADRMLEALVPKGAVAAGAAAHDRFRLDRPLDIVQGAWRCGALGLIAASTNVPPQVTEPARRRVHAIIGSTGVEPASAFRDAAAAWLNGIVPPLVESIDVDAQSSDAWALWLQCQRSLDGGDRFDAAVIAAVHALLRTELDLSRPGRASDLLGGLLSQLNYHGTTAVRGGFAAMFDDREGVSITDLWVLTSLVAVYDFAPWYRDEFIVPAEASWPQRNRVRDQVIAAWPSAGAQVADPTAAPAAGIRVNRLLGLRWRSRMDAEDAAPLESTETELLRHLLRALQLNEAAACLAGGNTDQAGALLDVLDTAGSAPVGGATGSGAASAPPPPESGSGPRLSLPPRRGGQRPGQPIGPDGQWAADYRAAAASTQQRLALLQALGSQAGTDLGLIDAELFVQEVCRGAPAEIRTLAQSIAWQRFATGPNVLLQLLEQLPDAPRTEDLSDMIGRITGTVLLPYRSEHWSAETRLALVQHTLAMKRALPDTVDDLAVAVVRSIAGQHAALERGRQITIVPRTPQEAEERLVAAWRDLAARVAATARAPVELPTLHRRQVTRLSMARGPQQEFIAWQLALLDLAAFITTAENPSAAAEVQHVLQSSARRRRDLDHALKQAIEVERAISRVWRIRLVIPEAST
jgi:hypothetical protein